ncbi:MAG: RHS repeat protein, partial [Bacteroidales bacterium]|nr:RHS repeat protein [Bacteroidales bacterium]
MSNPGTPFLPQMLSPSAYEIGRYGRTPVSYFHGLPNISIPLTEVRARGFTIPVSLSYHAGGNKPDQHPGWVGLGWKLNAGGCIVRVVNGKKDEMSSMEYGALTGRYDTPGYLHHIAEVQTDTNWDDDQTFWNKTFFEHIEYEPDEYIIDAPGIHASFYITGPNKIAVVSRDESAIELESYDFGNDSGTPELDMYPDKCTRPIKACRYQYLKRFIIKDKYGNRYIFGGDDNAIEYSIVQKADIIRTSTGVNNSNVWKAFATADAWMLTRIERADGEVIIFEYERGGVPIVLRDIHHGEIFTSADAYYMSGQADTHHDMTMGYKRNLNFLFLLPTYLKSIRCLMSGDELNFAAEKSQELQFAIDESDFKSYVADLSSEYSVVGPFSYSQFQEENYYRKLVSITGNSRDIRFSYTDNSLTRLKLNKIEICKCDGQKDGEYTFAYNETSLPAYNSRQTDIWGYYNGISYADLLGGFGSGLTARRIAVKEKMAAEILTCVTYPTGGRTEYTYEPHRYSKKALPFDFSPVACESEGEAGGLRIKTITDYSIDGEVPQVRTFEYSENGVSSGILSAEGECKIEGSQSFINDILNFTGSYVLYNEMPILPLSDTDGNHVTYSFVREIFPDGSYVDHRFSNFDASECQDYAPAKEIGRVTGCPLYPKFTSRSLFRGLLTERTTYRAGGNPVLQETFTYGNIGNPDRFKSVSRHSYFGERVVFAAYISAHCGYPGMLTKKEVRYLDDGSNLKEIYTYTYNAQRLLESSQCSRVSATYDEENPYVPYDSETNGERYYYPKDRSGESYARMLDEKMHGVLVGKAFLRKGKVTGGTETVYVEREISGWDPERSSLIVPHKQFSSELTLPESISGYSSSPMTCMKSTPDFEAKTWDSRGNAKFIDLRNGSAVEQHWSARTGQPGMRVVTLGNPPAIHDRKSINIRVNTEESTCFSTTFITTEDTTLSLTLGADYGHALYLCVQLDTQYSYLANWAIPELPDSNWESIVGMHGNTLNLNIPAGEHSLIITITGVKGPSGGSGADCGTLMGSYSEAVPLQDTAAFIDLDTDDETGDGFHCEKGHEGPLEVSHSVTDGRAYILDYMLREDGQWRYVKSPYIGGAVTIGGEGRTVSNVRIYPADSMPESFMWRRFTGMSARSDARGVTESYGYDDVGRLAEVRDNDGSLVRAHSYEFRNKGDDDAEGENRITSDEFTSADGESRRSSVNLYDGLGRLVRNVLVDGSPAGGDLVTRHEYDSMDREVKTWLPEVSSSIAPAMVPGLSPETGDLPSLEADTYLYTESIYEASPLNRLLRKYGPGQAWRTADKAVRMYQMSNKTDVSDPTYHRGFSISWSGNALTLTREMNCTSAGMLLVEKTEDEDGRIRLDFKNVHGETVLSRSVCDDGSWNDTHFIYDAFGRLAGVLPPKLTAQLESSGRSSWTESEICDLAYLYRYDSRGNNIAKLLPGGGWTWFVYDKGDRMVLSQDVIQREQGQWTFRLEDIFGRECVTGTAVLETDAFADPLGEVNVYVTMPASPDYADTLKGYVATGLSLGSSLDILKVSYYDGYGFLGSGPFPAVTDGAAAYDESAENGYGARYTLSERGLATGSLVRVLDSSSIASYLWSVAYYDDRGRPVQTCESIPSGGYRREYYAYDFTGAVTGRKSVLTPFSGAAVTVVQTFTYDPMGRPVSVTHKVGDLEPRTVSLKAYDAVGRLSSEQRNGLAALLETRTYNLRSWLTGIDCPLFKETLRYQDGTTPQWGGNISEMSWGPGTEAKNYRFGYDALSRLVSAEYSEGTVQASANARAGGLIGGGGIIGGEIVSEGHSESYHYDRNGNMDLLSRNNMMELIGVEGNRITSVGTKAVSYDAKGRQISSAHVKSVATQYNILDLPQKHTVGNADTEIGYKYSADGRKLQEKVTQGSSQTSRDYIGEFIYENGTLKKILFDGGYVDMIGDSPVYMFFIKDHLGSVRAVVSETGEVLQTNEFYPYGDLFSSSGTADTSGNRY